MQKCIYCGYKKLYILQTRQRKCARCKRKFSVAKYLKKERIKEAFCKGMTAFEASKTLQIGYQSVFKHYEICIKDIVIFLELEYEKNQHRVYEYDEYLYSFSTKEFEQSINFLIFDYGKIYTQLLPFAQKYKNMQQKSLKNFLRNSKLAKIEKNNNNIDSFLKFFIEFMKRYRGVTQERFIYYLKVCEFFYNYDYAQRKKVLELSL